MCGAAGLEREPRFCDLPVKGKNMRKLGLTMALASTALAAPALAKDNTWYVGADIGAMLVESDHDHSRTRAVANDPAQDRL